MKQHEMLDSIEPRYNPLDFNRRPRRRKRLLLAIVFLALFGIGLWLGNRFGTLARKIFEGADSKISFADFFLSKNRPISGEEEGQIRVLLMGIGGKNHEGGTLTDTLILATIQVPQKKGEDIKASLISIPRDLLVSVPGYGRQKINAAYAYGESGGKTQGPALAVETMEQVVGSDIPYYGVVDFQGFEKVINDLNGVEITVDQTFTDASYPDEKFGYLAPISFTAGKQKMDGARALQFARSRHGTNGEGSDFARSRRQQKVLSAIRDKVLNARTLTNLSLINRLLDDLADHIRTNFKPYEIKRLYEMTRDLDRGNIISLGLDGSTGLVCDKIEEETGAYFLIPCRGPEDYTDIRKLIASQFEVGALAGEKPAIEIQNAAQIASLAERAQTAIGNTFVTVTVGNYRGGAIYDQSIIYDNTAGGKPETLKYLQDKLGIKVAASPYPSATFTQKPDFVIILAGDITEKL